MDNAPRPVDLLFPDANRVPALTLNFCVSKPFGCGLPVTMFRDDLSWTEYGISGLCQDCQDKVFGA